MEVEVIMKKIYTKNSSLTNVLFFIIIIAIVNLISLNLFFRLDFSDGKIYSLSDASKNTIQYLSGRLIVKAYFSEDLPPQLADVKRYTKDILTEYKIASKGKIRFEFVSMSDEAKFKEDAQKNQIPPVNVSVQENDRMEVREVYLGLAFIYQDKRASIPMVKKTRGLEYEITKTIKQMSMIKLPQIAIYNPEPPQNMNPQLMRLFGKPPSEYAEIITLLRNSYEVQEVDLNEGINEFEEVTALIIPGIRDSLSENQLWTLDQLIMQNTKTIFLADMVNADLQKQQATPNESNVIDLLRHYGIKMKHNLIIDESCGQINIQEKRGIFSVQTPMSYPLFPVINKMNKNNPIVEKLENIQMIFASEIDTMNLASGINFTPLLYSSDQSGTIAGRFDIGINQFKNKNYYNLLTDGNKVLAGIYEGTFSSYFSNSERSKNETTYRPKSSNSKIILVSDGDFIKSSAAGRVPGNQNFIMNAVDYLSNNADLISLRSRAVENRPLNLKKITDISGLNAEQAESKLNKRRRFVKWINILSPAILLILFGWWNYRKEDKLRERIKEIYE